MSPAARTAQAGGAKRAKRTKPAKAAKAIAAARAVSVKSARATAAPARATQAVLFAAGPAQRLLPLTESRPKAMLLVGGKPLLHHAVTALARHGVKDLVVVFGAGGERIQAFLKDGEDFGVRAQYVHQPQPRGTMDAVRRAIPLLAPGQPALILPGHAFVDAALLAPLAKARSTAVLLANASARHVQGIPTVRGARLAGMQHGVPKAGALVTTNLLYAGPELLKAIADGELSASGSPELDLCLGDWAAHGGKVATLTASGPWHTLVDPWDLLRLNERVLAALAPPLPDRAPPAPGKARRAAGEAAEARGAGGDRRGAVLVGARTRVAPTAVLVGPVTIGEGCTIGEHTVVGPFVSIRNACVVGPLCEVRNSILNNNVVVDTRSVVRGCILDDGVQLGPGFLCEERATRDGPRGCIVGRDSALAAGAVVAGGAVLAPETSLAAGARPAAPQAAPARGRKGQGR